MSSLLQKKSGKKLIFLSVLLSIVITAILFFVGKDKFTASLEGVKQFNHVQLGIIILVASTLYTLIFLILNTLFFFFTIRFYLGKLSFSNIFYEINKIYLFLIPVKCLDLFVQNSQVEKVNFLSINFFFREENSALLNKINIDTLALYIFLIIFMKGLKLKISNIATILLIYTIILFFDVFIS